VDKKPLVSVITAAYNCAQHWPDLIQSLRAQTYENWEHIVVDDASTDSTYEDLMRFQAVEKRLKVVRNFKNAGAGGARNKAIANSNGDFVAIMDADDVSYPNRLELQVKYLENNPDVDVLGSAIAAIDQKGSFLEFRYRPERHEVLVDKIFYENPFYNSTVMFRPSFFKVAGGYNPKLRRCEDYDLWLRTYRKFRFHNLQKPLIQYRVKNLVSWASVFYSTLVLLRGMKHDRVPLLQRWIAFRGPAKKLLDSLPMPSSSVEFFASIYHRKK
jgi:GT2 family glycosyltransferase